MMMDKADMLELMDQLIEERKMLDRNLGKMEIVIDMMQDAVANIQSLKISEQHLERMREELRCRQS